MGLADVFSKEESGGHVYRLLQVDEGISEVQQGLQGLLEGKNIADRKTITEWLRKCSEDTPANCKNGCPFYKPSSECINDLMRAALELIEGGQQEADRWIPVTEALPEEKDAGILKKLGTNKRSDYVLATVEVKGEKMTVMACTHDGKWYWNMKHAFPDYKIIAWRPRPEPYEAEEET